MIGALLFAALLLPACSGGGGAGASRVTVFAAASLAEVFAEIAEEFETDNPEVTVKLNFAGSQVLRSQLELGAAADVFAPADVVQMGMAMEGGLVDGEPVIFATAPLAVIAAGKGSGRVNNLADLARPGARLVLAHPGVPVGGYSRQLLDSLSGAGGLGSDFSARVYQNVVSEEPNVRNVEQKVALGEADAGIVYRPLALAAAASGNVRIIPVPEAHNVLASFPIAELRESNRQEAAAGFVEFVLSEPGQEILRSHGFDSP